MTYENFFNTLRNLLVRTLALAFCCGILSVASYAQSANIYFMSGGAYFGRVTVFPGSHFQIDTYQGTVIKTFANSCRPANSGGVPGLLCSFAQFSHGRHMYSGWAYFFQNGIVYLMWTNENVGGIWRTMNGSWVGFRP